MVYKLHRGVTAHWWKFAAGSMAPVLLAHDPSPTHIPQPAICLYKLWFVINGQQSSLQSVSRRGISQDNPPFWTDDKKYSYANIIILSLQTSLVLMTHVQPVLPASNSLCSFSIFVVFLLGVHCSIYNTEYQCNYRCLNCGMI